MQRSPRHHCNGFVVVVVKKQISCQAVYGAQGFQHTINSRPPRFPSLCNAVSHVHGTPVALFREEHWATFCWASQPVVWQAFSL